MPNCIKTIQNTDFMFYEELDTHRLNEVAKYKIRLNPIYNIKGRFYNVITVLTN